MRKPALLLIPIFVLGGAAVLYFWAEPEKPQPQTVQAPAVPAEPAIRHPIEEASPAAEPAEAPANPLPALDESDGVLRDALAGLFGPALEKFFNLQDIVSRSVATVDSLTRDHLSPRVMPLKPVAGLPVTEGEGDTLVLSSNNAARYDTYVRVAEAAPTRLLVATYVQFYPLFQQRYEQLGYPDKYFNDRVVDVIDHLLATPETRAPVLLTQPRILYEFADPKLEGLSAGQKILVRMGNGNAAKVKSKLREIRTALVPKAE